MMVAYLMKPSVDQLSMNQSSMDEPSIGQPLMDESRKLSRRSQSLGSAMSGERTAMAQSPPNAEATGTGFRHRSLSASSRGFPAIRILIPADEDDDACDDTRCDDTPCDDSCDRASDDVATPPHSVQAAPFPMPRGNSVEVDRLWEVHASPCESKSTGETTNRRQERLGGAGKGEKKARNAEGAASSARAPKPSPLGSANGFARMLLQWAPSSARSSRRKKRGDSATFGFPAPRSQSVVQSSQSQHVADVSSELNRDASARASESASAVCPGAEQAEEPPREFSARPRTAPTGIFSRWRSAAPLSRPKSPLFGLTYMGASARRGVSGDALPEGNELSDSGDAAASADPNNGAAYSGDRLRSIFAQGTRFSVASERPWSSGGWGATDGAWRTGGGGGWDVADGAGESVSERGDAEREDIERRVSYSSSTAGAAGSVVSSSTAAYTETAYSETLIIQHTDRDTGCESVTSASSCSGYDALAWGGSAPMGGGNAQMGGENAPLGGGNAVIGGENALTGDESALIGGRNARLGETLADGGGGDFATLWRSLPRDLRRTRSLQSPRGYPGGNAGGGFGGESRGNGGHVANGSSRSAEGEDQGSYVQQGSMRRMGSAEMLPAVAHGSFVPAVTGAAGAGPLTPSAHTPADLPPTSPRSAGGAAWVVSVPSFAQHRLRVASAERAARGGGEGRGAGEGRGGGEVRMADQDSQDQQQQQPLPPRAHRRTRSLHAGDMEWMRLEQIGEFTIPSFHHHSPAFHHHSPAFHHHSPAFHHSPSTLRHALHSPSAPLLQSRPSPSVLCRSPSLRSPCSPRLPPLSPRIAAGPSSVRHRTAQHPTAPDPTAPHPTAPHPSASYRFPKSQSLCSPSSSSSSSIRASAPPLPHRPPVCSPSGIRPGRSTRSGFEAAPEKHAICSPSRNTGSGRSNLVEEPNKQAVFSPSGNTGHGRSFRNGFELPLPTGGHCLIAHAATACEGRESLAVEGQGVFTAVGMAENVAAACATEVEGGKWGRFRGTPVESSPKSSTPRRPFRRCRSLGAGIGEFRVGGRACDSSEASAYSHSQVDSKQCHTSKDNRGGTSVPHDCFPVTAPLPPLPLHAAAPFPQTVAATVSEAPCWFPQAVTAPLVVESTPEEGVSVAPVPPVVAWGSREAVATAVHVAPRDWVEDSYCFLKDEDGVVVPCAHELSDYTGFDCYETKLQGSDCNRSDCIASDSKAVLVRHEQECFLPWQHQQQ
ncbi:unnamed protein product [Closterium sp. NIES-53]